ncbi:MAG: IclR family transcriptional regulator C-terminal domain-containing protein [Xanthobacteraceae bacterium]
MKQHRFINVAAIRLSESLSRIRYVRCVIGESMPLHATSGGKVILASMQKSQCERILSRMRLTKVTANTITSYRALRKELAATAKTKIAYSREEFEEGVIGISVAF